MSRQLKGNTILGSACWLIWCAEGLVPLALMISQRSQATIVISGAVRNLLFDHTNSSLG